MKSAPILLVALGLILLYVVLSDKYQCFTMFFECLTGADLAGTGEASGLPQLPSTGQPRHPTNFPGIFDPNTGGIRTPTSDCNRPEFRASWLGWIMCR